MYVLICRLCTYMPELSLPDKVESITYAQSTDDEKMLTPAPLGTISMAAITGDFPRPAHKRNRSASAAYTALPCSYNILTRC